MIINYIKNNKELFLVILLIIMFVFIKISGVSKEGFESTVANSVSVIEQKFNQAFGIINANDVEILQNVNIKRSLNVDGVIVTKGADFRINSDSRRGAGTGPRRALVHNVGDRLAINFAGDYKGGVGIHSNVAIAGNIATSGNINVAAGKSICIGGTCINESHLKMLTDGISIQPVLNGHHKNKFIHLHTNGIMAIARDGARTKFKITPYNTAGIEKI